MAVVQSVQTAAVAAGAVAPVVVTHVTAVVTHPAVQQGLAWLNSVAPTVLAFLTGAGVSVIHSFIKRENWSPQVNTIIFFSYCVVLAVFDAWAKGVWNVGGISLFFLTVVGASQAWYKLLFLVSNAETTTKPLALPVNATP